MSGVKLIGAETPRKLQELARHQFITRMYKEILFDMQVCETEGWDRMEFINQIREALNFTGGNNGRTNDDTGTDRARNRN